MAFLGVDVGGSNSRSAWLPATAAAPGRADGVQPAVVGADAAVPQLAAMLRQLAPDQAMVQQAVLAIAGAGERELAAALTSGLQRAGIGFPLCIVGDVLAASAAALAEHPGVLLWSGTGSFAVARGRDGSLVRVGGRGFLLGDQGSAYDLVRRAAAVVVLAADALAPPTALTAALTQAFSAPSPQRLGAVLQRLDTAAVARQLAVVLEVAAGGDEVANQVLLDGAAALAVLAQAAARQADLDRRDLPVALGGGVLLAVPGYAALVRERLAGCGFAAPTEVGELAAAGGAARLAEALHLHRQPLASWVQHVAL